MAAAVLALKLRNVVFINDVCCVDQGHDVYITYQKYDQFVFSGTIIY